MKSKVNSFPPACSDHSNHVRHEGNHGISTAFFRLDFKGARSRACVRACVDDGESGREAHSSSHCADVSRKKLPCLPIAQPDGPVFGQQNRKRKESLPPRSTEKWPLDPVARGHENRAWIEAWLLCSARKRNRLRWIRPTGFRFTGFRIGASVNQRFKVKIEPMSEKEIL